MNLLITGGLGYLGGRISQYLCDSGHDLLIATRQDVEAPAWLTPGSRLIKIDLEDPDLSRLDSVDAVIHLAATNELECAKSPERSIEINTIGTLRLIQAIERLQNVRRFVYFSTAHVYGAPLTGFIAEHLPTRPVHPYAYSHRASEDLVFSAEGRAFDRGIVIRLSNGFGYPERPTVNRWSLLVNDLCRQIAQTGAIKLTSDGTQYRDFIPLGDVARATQHLLHLDNRHLGDGLYNVGSGKSLSVMEMACLVRAVACEFLNTDLPPVSRLEPDRSTPAQKLEFSSRKLFDTGFSCRADWQEEIRKTLAMCLAVENDGIAKQ